MKSNALKIIIVILLLVALLGMGGYFFLTKDMNGPFKSIPSDAEVSMVEIPEGSSTVDIGTILERNGIIKDAKTFKIFSKIKGYDGKYLAGKYYLSPGMTTEEIVNIIISGVVREVSFTIPEGFTLDQIADTLSEAGLVDRERFLNITENGDFSEYDFLEGTVSGRHRLEGFLFPETYSVPEDADEETIIRTMLNQFGTIWERYRDRANELNMSANEVITVASLIEREAVLDQDRKLVSSVIYNRLEAGMPLQIDATINFALALIGEDHEYLTYEDLEIDSPYNTYKIPELPPGPIACPGERCIEAALYPPETEYLFYVKTTDQGVGMSFSTNYEDFISDVEAWDATIENDQNN